MNRHTFYILLFSLIIEWTKVTVYILSVFFFCLSVFKNVHISPIYSNRYVPIHTLFSYKQIDSSIPMYTFSIPISTHALTASVPTQPLPSLNIPPPHISSSVMSYPYIILFVPSLSLLCIIFICPSLIRPFKDNFPKPVYVHPSALLWLGLYNLPFPFNPSHILSLRYTRTNSSIII